jgi:hypothetical protein
MCKYNTDLHSGHDAETRRAGRDTRPTAVADVAAPAIIGITLRPLLFVVTSGNPRPKPRPTLDDTSRL